jgi:hypothetical protein
MAQDRDSGEEAAVVAEDLPDLVKALRQAGYSNIAPAASSVHFDRLTPQQQRRVLTFVEDYAKRELPGGLVQVIRAVLIVTEGRFKEGKYPNCTEVLFKGAPSAVVFQGTTASKRNSGEPPTKVINCNCVGFRLKNHQKCAHILAVEIAAETA